MTTTEVTRKNKPRQRAFKACALCRSRKAKCEFSNSGDHGLRPCLRCQKEGEQCQFLPTRRGGNHGNGYTARKARELAGAATLVPEKGLENQNSSSQPTLAPGTHFEDSQVDVEHLTEAPLRNPSDALEILARTSPPNRNNGPDYDEDDEDEEERRCLQRNHPAQNQADSGSPDASQPTSSPDMLRVASRSSVIVNVSPTESTYHRNASKSINSFPLIKLGLINPAQLRTYVAIFASRNNHYLPIIPENRLPSDDHHLGQFAAEEPFLLMVIVLIASRFEKDTLHAACWEYTRRHLSGITYGGLPTVGVVEGLLLLSENLPKLPKVADDEFHKVEAFVSWNLIGLAVRFGYFLGLDQKTLLPPTQKFDRQTSRERLVWTYCHVFNRQVSIRLGKELWSRGPGLAIQNPSTASMSTPLEARSNLMASTSNTTEYPTDIGSSNSHQNEGSCDNAGLLQTYVELTQILTNIHDVLYPSRDRTIALVNVGEYYRILDEFTRTITAFNTTCELRHQWELNETIHAVLQYTKLYAYAFAFQAHVQRTTSRHKEQLNNMGTTRTLAELIFPLGVAGCPDAKYILEAIESASKLLTICVNGLFNNGALAYLPSRFYGYFSYAAVFLIKVVLTGAIASSERKKILTLVGRTITALESSSSGADKQHLGARSARQLKTLVRTLVVATGTSMAPTPARCSPAPREQQQLPDISISDHDYALYFNELDIGPGLDSAMAPMIDTTFLSEPFAPDLAALFTSDIDSDMWLSFF
ncbi:hypothetical protein EDD37DRAFT_629018 [Exophiala viscosa]|uniref:uncharacterized protein n=1 Tax=Exophiala viscosa TaxID=2486360 RepID=UPI0021955692|nr:hypothetical protein EDD37DRAFT_629018 [Exophiala viscosa]